MRGCGAALNLYWLVYQTANGKTVYLQQAHTLIAARMRAALANVEGDFAEGHELDVKTEKKVPKKFISRALTQREAVSLLEKLR